MSVNRKLPGDITVVGLGYVGLPLSLAFSKKLPTTGFDIDASRVEELQSGDDRNREVKSAEITSSGLALTTDASCIADAEFIIVTVPTPVTGDHKPDLRLLESASKMIGNQLRERADGLPAPIIVYESTTYPGCTEEFCGPAIERESGLKAGVGFFLGYSPERTNFGDDEHTLETVIKVVSGQNAEVASTMSNTYGLVAEAGTHVAPNIKTAEASKVIENVQRDLNIALFNELAMIFDRMDIRSSDVFDAAATKWNFHRYQPGLVGGHCIPVDPYYLTYAAAEAGYEADIVLAGRAVNEEIPEFISLKAESLLREQGTDSESAAALVLGATFKRDVTDIRNSKAIELTKLLTRRFGNVQVYDPYVSAAKNVNLPFDLVDDPFESGAKYELIVVAVAHSEFGDLSDRLGKLLSPNGIIVDVSGSFFTSSGNPPAQLYWTL